MAAIITIADRVILSGILSRLNTTIGSNYNEFKKEQARLLFAATSSDCIGVLPTGYGKTLIIEALPFAHENIKSSVVAISPLNAILTAQKKKFGSSSIVIDDAVLQQCLTHGPQTHEIWKLMSGNYLYILGHPEYITNEYFIRNVLKPLEKQISHCVVDEANCLLSWGKSEFRPGFLKIATLRSVLPNVKFVALTATATKASQEEIKRELRMKNVVVVSCSPNRQNVFIDVKKRPSTGGHHDVCDIVDFVINNLIIDIVNQQSEFPKTIVFFSHLKWCGYSHFRTVRALCDAGIIPPREEISALTSELVGQYHSPQQTNEKESIAEAFHNGKLRLLFATEAFGMGVDVPDIRRIIHAGPPMSLEVYAQEIGRCGRDGLPATALLYFNKCDIRNINNISMHQ